jgi:hypothetical protein
MWKLKILYVIQSLSIISCTNPEFRLDDHASGKLSVFPGQIEVEFVGSDKHWHYSIVNGKLSLQSVKDFPPAHLGMPPYVYFPDEAPKEIPKVQGFEYHGPYSLSPDKALMVLSISSETKGASNPKDFALIDMERKEVLFQRRSNNKYIVEDIAWASDSSIFVVLDETRRRHFGVSGIISYMLGHPVDVCKYYLSIYDRKGDLLVNSEVASGLIGGSGRVSWRDK